MKILVTGSEGYIGSVLVPSLMSAGHSVIGLDIGYFEEALFNQMTVPEHPIIKKDMRSISSEDIDASFDAVVHLAALSNDPLGKLDEQLTLDINYHATMKLAEICKAKGIPRFIFFSSCSLYGCSYGEALTESAEPNPQTAYAKSKVLCEAGLSAMADDTFSPTFLRNGTVYGVSPRMRFDLVANGLSGYAQAQKEICVWGDGKPWRPLVHIKDICDVTLKVLESPMEKVHNEAFNVGDTKENYQVIDIANKVRAHFPDTPISIEVEDAGDTRDYNVCFDKLNHQLEYVAKVDLDNGIEELKHSYESADLDQDMFYHRHYSRIKQIEHLLDTGVLDEKLNYRQP